MFDPGLWLDPPEDFSNELRATSSQCEVDCSGIRWTSSEGSATLTLLMYRNANFDEAIASAVGVQTFYLQRDYASVEVPPGGNLPAFTWAGQFQEKDYVIITTQGPAIIILFWQNIDPVDPGPVLNSLARYAGVQAAALRNVGFLTSTMQLTPFP